MDLDEYFGTSGPRGLEYLDELAAKGYEGRMHEEQLEEIQERIRDKEYLPISINVESLLLREEKDAYLFRIPRGRLGEDLSSAIRIKKSDCILLDEGADGDYLFETGWRTLGICTGSKEKHQ